MPNYNTGCDMLVLFAGNLYGMNGDVKQMD